MVSEKEIILLKKTINVFNNFIEREECVNSGREYIEMYQRNLKTIQKIAEERKSEFLKKKLEEYPKLNAEEIEDYIRKIKQKEKNLIFLVFAYPYYFIIDRIIRMIKTQGSTPAIIKTKISKIGRLNEKVLKVIENPDLEEVYIKLGE